MKKNILLLLLFLCHFQTRLLASDNMFNNPARTYALPTLTKNLKNEVVLSWTEKDDQGIVFYYFASSVDNGKTFSDKKLIYSSPSIGTSQLMRPRLLFKKDGSMVAVFSSNPTLAAANPKVKKLVHEHTAHEMHEAENAKKTPKSASGGRPRDLQVQYTISKDGGQNWSTPKTAHSAQTPNIIRGFFDAIILANGEVAVAFLKDIPNKPHERDMRLVISKGDIFETEKIIDSLPCDCCNISLLVDTKGILNVYYRDNNDNIRDIAVLTSTDNGVTFSKSKILYADNWKINGCPHSGPVSTTFGASNLVAYFSGTEKDAGIRVVTQEGKKLFVLTNPSAQNAHLLNSSNFSVLLWEQQKDKNSINTSQIAYRKIMPNNETKTIWIGEATNGTFPSGIMVDNQLIVAYVVSENGKANAIKISTLSLQEM